MLQTDAANKIAIVVVGATGLVGRQLVRHCSAAPDRYDLYAQVRDPNALKPVANLQVFSGDLAGIHEGLFPQTPHVLVHLAVKHIDRDGSGFDEVNVRGTENLLQNCNRFTRGIIYGSTLSVQGQGAQTGIAAEAPRCPQTPLARSRAQAEQRVLDFARAAGVSGYCLRPRFILGVEDQYVLPALARLVQQGIYIGDGTQRFAVIHVADYAHIIARLCERILKGAPVEQLALNVGYQQPLSFASMYAALQPESAATVRRKTVPTPALLARFLKKIPLRRAFDTATRLELIGVDHFGDVALTMNRVGHDILSRSSAECFISVVKETALSAGMSAGKEG